MESDDILRHLQNNGAVINICTTAQLLEIWLRERRMLYTFRGAMKTESWWAVGKGKEKQCCFCKNKSTFYLFEGYHSHYCPIKHPICRGIIRGGEVNVCDQCLEWLNTRVKTAKQFIKNLLYIWWGPRNLSHGGPHGGQDQGLIMDVINTIGTLFEKLIIRDHPSMFIDC